MINNLSTINKKLRFHLLTLPHTIPNKEFYLCAFTAKVVRLAKELTRRGHEVMVYGHEEGDVVCTEYVNSLPKKDFDISYGDHEYKKKLFKFDMQDHAYQTYYKNTIEEIRKRKQPHDFILAFWGVGHLPICEQFKDLIIVEPGIGYAQSFAPFRVYESYSIMHSTAGSASVANCNPQWYHVVIPNYFDPEDFVYSEEKEDYFLQIGRVYPGKGVDIAVQVCQSLGMKLLIAGQLDGDTNPYPETDMIQYIGSVNVEQRKGLMAKAKGGFCMSLFNEPFCGVNTEFHFSGTPVISSDWGALSENNIHGKTGYRCRTFEQIKWAAQNIDKIKPSNCRKWAINNFSAERVGNMYEEYFDMCHRVYTGGGWYDENPERMQLNWLSRDYDFE